MSKKKLSFVGVDFAEGAGVDVILKDPYSLPFVDNYADIVVSSSCFEHSEMFWLLFLEIMRILKPSGIFYLNVPSNGAFHRYPVDCWRFYPDSGNALVLWAVRNKIDAYLLESFINAQDKDIWNDYVAVFLKNKKLSYLYTSKMIYFLKNIENVFKNNGNKPENYSQYPQDWRQNNLIRLAPRLLREKLVILAKKYLSEKSVILIKKFIKKVKC